MSENIFNSIKQEAISRMRPYELAERAIQLKSQEQNTLDIGPMELENGATLHTVSSALFANEQMQTELTITEGDLVRRQFSTNPATLIANIVELRPPNEDHRQGSAKLYRLQESLELPTSEARLPFRTTAIRLLTMGGNLSRGVPLGYDRLGNIFYDTLLWSDEEADYLSSKNLPLLATEGTAIHVDVIGKNELDKEVGVRPTLSGPVKVALAMRQFLRITDDGVFYGPAQETRANLTIDADAFQKHQVDYYRIPDNARVVPDTQGRLVPQCERVDQQQRHTHQNLSPDLDAGHALKLIGPETIDWTDATGTFMKSTLHRLGASMPFDAPTAYNKVRQLARDKIYETLPDGRTPLVGETGCLAVAACVSELPDLPEARRIGASFFQ